jgi:hypothetical protein
MANGKGSNEEKWADGRRREEASHSSSSQQFPAEQLPTAAAEVPNAGCWLAIGCWPIPGGQPSHKRMAEKWIQGKKIRGKLGE